MPSALSGSCTGARICGGHTCPFQLHFGAGGSTDVFRSRCRRNRQQALPVPWTPIAFDGSARRTHSQECWQNPRRTRTAECLAAHLSEIKTNLENGEAQLQIYISNPHHHFPRQCSSSRNRTGTQFIPGRG